MNKVKVILVLITALTLFSCSKEEGCTDIDAINFNPEAEKDDGSCLFSSPNLPNPLPNNTTASPIAIPPLFTQTILPPFIPTDNPQTVEGIALGRQLFYDPILSSNNTISCASCHFQSSSFSDMRKFSSGVGGALGTRNSMPLYNLAWNWNGNYFWDGKSSSLEEQALAPIINPLEMANTIEQAITSLQNTSNYPSLFMGAFGSATITSDMLAKAIAQFERTLISANSKFDRFLLGQEALTAEESSGFDVFISENKGDCFHCHGDPSNPLWTDNDFHNNGLDNVFDDNGLGDITGKPSDNGKFRTPSLRNLSFTAPYMHDGRFATIDEVIDHYSEGLVTSSTIDPLMKAVNRGGVQLSPKDKSDLKAFLLSLNDDSFMINPDFQKP